jgi:hypothetical protein
MAVGDNEPGIIQLIKLLLDQASANKAEADMKKALKDGTDPEPAKRNLKQVNQALDGVKQLAGEVAAALGIAFGIKKIIDFSRESVKAALDSRAVWAQLSNAIKNVGIDYNTVSADIQKNAMQFLRAGIMGDEEFGTVLTTLVQMSGNYEKSLRNVSVVADVAAARHLDLEKAAQLVGMAMDGNATRLKMLGVDVPKGADAVKYLADQYRGAAEAQDPLIRKQKALAETWDNLKEAVGEAIIGLGEGRGLLDGLIDIITQVTKAVEENKDQIMELGKALEFVGRGSLAFFLLEFAGWAKLSTAVALGLSAVAEMKAKLWSKRDPTVAAEAAADAARLAAFADAANDAADAAKKLAENVMTGKGATGATTPKRPDLLNGPPGGAVHGARAGDHTTGPKGPSKTSEEMQDEIVQKDEAIFRRRVEAAKVLNETDETRTEGLQRLMEVQQELNDYMGKMNLTWEQRAEIMKEQRDIQDALIEGLKKMADEYGVTTKALDEFAEGHIKAGVTAIKSEAKSRAAWNVAVAIEELARSIAAGATGNVAGASAHLAAMKSHLASAAKWAALAAGAGLAGAAGGGGSGSGGSSSSNGPTGLGSDAAAVAKAPGTQVSIYVDGFDPRSTKQQDWLAMANEDIRQRYGDDSAITILPATAGRQ